VTRSAAGAQLQQRTPRRFLGASSLVVLVTCLLQQPGRLLADTKVDLFLNPMGFLGRALHFWEAQGYFGQLQNQAVGYFLPMGPFFALGHASGAPMWIVHRLWMSLLLVVALWGTVRVADALGIGSITTRFMAGATYALSPFFVMVIGSTSSNLLPAALLPWALLPLIRGSQEGSTVAAAARSGLFVAAMSGINGMATAAVLPLLALWILTRQRSARRRSLLIWWTVSMVLACLWWAIPLLLEARYGFNFLLYTEQASTTTAYTSVVEAMRGTSHWLSYYNFHDPWLPAGWMLVSNWAVILATGALAAVGLVGLAHRALPERKFLVLCLAAGMVAVASGYGGTLGGAFSAPVQVLLTKVAALRNIHKFEPLIRLPLALGLGHALALLVQGVRIRRLATAAVVFALALGASPFMLQRIAQRGTFTDLPSYWQEAADFLHANGGDGWTLVLPASTFGQYTWGRPLDEPLQILDASPWVVRNLVPPGPGSGELLDAVERQLQSGVHSPGLGEFLGRAGVRYVLVRNDLDYARSDSLSPILVHEALVGAGLLPVAAFGPGRDVALETDRFVPELGLAGLESSYQAVEIFQVDSPSLMVATYPQSDQLLVTGGPESLLSLANRGLLDGRAAVLAADAVDPPDGKALWAITDGARLRDVDFGLIHNNASYVLSATEHAPGRRRTQLVDVLHGLDHRTVNELTGVRSVTASSYGSWLVQVPELAPANAFDGDPDTAWVAANSKGSEGQWLQVDLNSPLAMPSITVRLLEEGRWRPAVTAMRVSTDRGSITTPVVPTEGDQQLAVPSGTTRRIRITFDSVEGEVDGLAGAGVREVVIPGVSLTQTLHVPAEAAANYAGPGAATPFYAFDRSVANPHDLLRQDEEKTLRREFTVPRAGPFPVSGTVVPVKGEPLDALLAGTSRLEVTASSSWNADPQFRAGNLVDNNSGTAWIAQPPGLSAASFGAQPGARALGRDPLTIPSGTSAPANIDPAPTIHLHWGEPRTIDRLRIVRTDSFAAPPERVRLSTPDGERTLSMSPDGMMSFPPLTTNRIDVSFPQTAVRETVDALTGRRTLVPIGLAEIDFPALRDLRPSETDRPRTVQLPCGQGPNVTIDGVGVPTAVEASIRTITDLQPVPFTVCQPAAFALGPGTHRLEVQPTATFAAASLTLGAPPPAPPTGAGPSVVIERWQTNSRDLTLGPGEASYLAVRQNFNDGWQARLDGRVLRPILLDGWQQGFVVPGGAGGKVHLRYLPDTWYRSGLLLGLGALLTLVVMSFLVVRRRTVVHAAAAADGRIGTGMLVLGVLAIVLVGGPLVVVFIPLGLLARRRRHWLGWMAGGAFLLAGMVVAVHAGRQPATHSGAFGWPAQALSVLSLASVFASLIGDGIRDLPLLRGISRVYAPLDDSTPDDAPPPAKVLVPAQMRHARRLPGFAGRTPGGDSPNGLPPGAAPPDPMPRVVTPTAGETTASARPGLRASAPAAGSPGPSVPAVDPRSPADRRDIEGAGVPAAARPEATQPSPAARQESGPEQAAPTVPVESIHPSRGEADRSDSAQGAGLVRQAEEFLMATRRQAAEIRRVAGARAMQRTTGAGQRAEEVLPAAAPEVDHPDPVEEGGDLHTLVEPVQPLSQADRPRAEGTDSA